ncbi:DUF502 domain-containing protein [Teredinibacter waterburyi]|uniref:DUF502 domain-containing protein n=1 Tax=Teredinibacter waterburyi TaxID=1500538 RepID=UPI00165FFB45|nr:DUF502 domain-containing protein [Teredinibacter waterburyi]
MKSIVNTFFKGMLFVLPLVITFGLIYWVFSSAESLLKIPLQWLLPSGWYIPGMGLFFSVVLIFVIGVLVQAYLIRHLFRWLEILVGRIPLVKTLYGSAKDLLHFMAGDTNQDMQKVVMVTLDQDVRMIGFVTRDKVSLGSVNDLQAVYLPMSYQMGGYLIYLPKDRCEELDIPVQQAMQQVLTANMTQHKS